MSWISQNPGIIIQAALTIIGSAVAIWIAVFQQRTAERREKRTADRKVLVSAPIIMRELLEFFIDLSAKIVSLTDHNKYFPELTEAQILDRTKVQLSNSITPNFGNAEAFGCEITNLLVNIQVSLSSYNAAQTIPNRIRAGQDLYPKVRELDKELGRLLGI